jgi:hypothetical protein
MVEDDGRESGTMEKEKALACLYMLSGILFKEPTAT